MRTQPQLWRTVDNQQDKAHGRLQSTDPFLFNRAWSDLLNGRPISFQGPSGQEVTLDREIPRLLCDAVDSPIRRKDGPETSRDRLTPPPSKQPKDHN